MAEGGAGKGGEEDPGKSPEQEEGVLPQVLHGAGHCKWFNVRMGFGFISMTSRGGSPVDPPLDVFVHQSKLFMEGFRSLKEGEPVEFTFKKSSKGLESLRVTGPGAAPAPGSERRPKGKTVLQKRKPKGDRCYNCGGLDHHAKECSLPPQPKKCHYCQSIAHMVAHCPHKTLTPPPPSCSSQGRLGTDLQASTSASALPLTHRIPGMCMDAHHRKSPRTARRPAPRKILHGKGLRSRRGKRPDHLNIRNITSHPSVLTRHPASTSYPHKYRVKNRPITCSYSSPL